MLTTIVMLVAMFVSIIVTENYMLDILQKDNPDKSTTPREVAD